MIAELTGNVSNYEKRVQLLLDENFRLSEHSVARLKEINELKINYQKSLSTHEGSLSSREIDIQSIPVDFKEMITKLEVEKNAMEEQMKQFKKIIDMHRNEIVRLEEINSHRKRENDWLSKQVKLTFFIPLLILFVDGST